jgi:glycosyltransferase involved in cell wall biosynthesis
MADADCINGSMTSETRAMERRLRVLILVENLPVPLDRRVWQEACALRDAGHEVTVICPQMRGYTKAEEILEGIQIYRHWISDEAKGIRGFILEYATALWGESACALKAWRRTGFDVIHVCNPPDLLFLVALPFKLLAGVKIIFDVHDLWPEMFEAKFGKRGLLYWAVRLAERATLALADAVMATNQSVLTAVKQRGRKNDDEVFIVRTAPNKLDTSIPPDQALKKSKKHLVGYIGVMGNADGVHYLIEAARHIVQTRGRQDVHFLLMGSGPEHTELLRLRDALGLTDFIDMPGRVTNEFLFTGLQTMDLGVACDPINAYNDHCTMNKTLEYMAFSKAQVMFGTREGRFSAGEAAHYVMENSAEKLGDAVLDLLDDLARREQMGRLGQRRLKTELNWEKSVQELQRAYARAMI